MSNKRSQHVEHGRQAKKLTHDGMAYVRYAIRVLGETQVAVAAKMRPPISTKTVRAVLQGAYGMTCPLQDQEDSHE